MTFFSEHITSKLDTLLKRTLASLSSHICAQPDHRKDNPDQPKEGRERTFQENDLTDQREDHFHGLGGIDRGDLIGMFGKLPGVEKDRCGNHT